MLKHFKPEEFACKCGVCGLGLAEMDPRLLAMLDEIRGIMGRPMKINSAVRCADHNAAIGATEKSEHVPQNSGGFCTAVDIHIPDSRYMFELIKLLFEEEVPRIGYNQGWNFVHVGLSQAHPQNVFFKY